MYTRTIRYGPGYQWISNNHVGIIPKGTKREPKRKRTPEEMDKQNARNRARQLQLIILGNFKEGCHVTLTYKKDKRPRDALEAKADLQKFHRRMKAKLKKAGFDYKWVAVTEIGRNGAVHHHLILEELHSENFSTMKAVNAVWDGIVYSSMLYEDGSFEQLSDYLTKKETKEKVPGCKVSHSRNLILPKAKRKRMKGAKWRAEPKVPKGWMLVKDSLWNGFNVFSGYPCQQYLLIELPKNKSGG